MHKKTTLAIFFTFFMLVLLFSPIKGSTQTVSDFQNYFSLVKKYDKYAIVTGWFWDWRSLSIYRSQAGYHYGYDIALPAGTTVPSGWSGIVIAVVPWTHNEWGVTVKSSNNYTVTYGHIKPLLSVGSTVNTGTPIGVVSYDHVDIKMRDSYGNFVDFDKTFGLLPRNAGQDCIINGLVLGAPGSQAEIIKAMQNELTHRRKNLKILSNYRKERDFFLKNSLEAYEKMKTLCKEELISASELENHKKEYEKEKKINDSLLHKINVNKKQIAMLEKNLLAYNAPISKAESEKTSKATSKIKSEDEKKIQKSKEKVEKYRELLKQGAVSSKQVKEVEAEYRKIKMEIRYRDI